jgi:glycosyltransferase involved in cell wall biosynthesis
LPGHPLVSIVTPSLNMGGFVEQAIRSVLEQDYAPIEYIVMDGGSCDGTLAVLERYNAHLRFQSEPDGGAAAAIRRGFECSSGEILAYLNADDLYLPGAVSAAIRAFEENPEAAVVYAEASWIDRDGNPIGRYPTRDFDVGALARECYLCQPAVFFRRSAYESVGGIDPQLQYTFDYDLWLKLARDHSFVYLKQPFARSRMYPENKTLGARRGVFRETIRTVKKHAGYAGFGHVYAYASHLLDGRDQFFEPLRPSMSAFGLGIVLGTLFNGPSCPEFWRECLASIGWLRAARQSILTSR